MRFLFVIFLVTLVVPVAAAKNQGVEAPTQVDIHAIPVCYDFGCKSGAVVDLPVDEWLEVEGWFSSAAPTPEHERQQIKQAIGWMEVLIGRHTPAHKDLAFNLPTRQEDLSDLFPGQQDCIDEAVNTTTYMRLLEQKGLLRHHTVIEQAYRKALFDQHWAGQIRETVSGERYVVDSWFQPNGYLPVIQNSLDWENITPLSAVVDHSRRDETPDADRNVLAGTNDHCGFSCQRDKKGFGNSGQEIVVSNVVIGMSGGVDSSVAAGEVA